MDIAELNNIDNTIKRTIADINNTFTLKYSDNTDIPAEWRFTMLLEDNYFVSADVYIEKAYTDKPSYAIQIEFNIYDIRKYFRDIDYQECCYYLTNNNNVDILADNIKQTYNKLIDKFEANKK